MRRNQLLNLSLEEIEKMISPEPQVTINNGGLNDGLLNIGDTDYDDLTGDDFFENPEQGEFPIEVKEDLRLLTTTEAYATDLAYLVSDVKQARGINIQFAMEGQRILADQFPIPTSYFTETPTQTQFKASMESFIQGFKDFIKNAITALKRLIKRFICWVLGKPYKEGDLSLSKADYQSAAKEFGVKKEHLHKQADAYWKISGMVSNFAKEVNNNTFTYKNLHGDSTRFTDLRSYLEDQGAEKENSSLHQVYNNFVLGKDPYYNDLLDSKILLQEVIDLNYAIDSTADRIAMKVNRLKSLPHYLVDGGDHESYVNEIKSPIMLKKDGTEVTISDYLEQLQDRRQRLIERQPREKHTQFADVLLPVMEFFRNTQVDKALDAAGRLFLKLSELDQSVEEIQKATTNMDEKESVIVVSTINALSREMASTFQLHHALITYLMSYMKLSVKCVKYTMQLITDLARNLKADNLELVKKISHEKDTLQSQITQYNRDTTQLKRAA